MSVTAVPILPIARGSIARLWIGVGAVALAAAGLAWAGQQGFARLPTGFMAQNAHQPGVITTESGLQYRIVKQGEGEKPGPGDVALVGYKGTLVDGKVFDQNEQAPMPIDSVVPGFAEGLQLMQRGGEYQLFIPPHLAYGDKVPAGGPIPPNSVLIFDVKMLDFKSRQEIMQMQQQMQQMQAEAARAAGQ
jgi:FKBP-type peptidyl-prolyl cis-trans isomerase FkpA